MLIRAVNNERNANGTRIQVRHTINYLPISQVARPLPWAASVDYVGNCSATNQLEESYIFTTFWAIRPTSPFLFVLRLIEIQHNPHILLLPTAASRQQHPGSSPDV